MRRVHPLWRGFWLACAMTVLLTLAGGMDWLAMYRLDRAALGGGLLVGAFLAALPGRIRRRKEQRPALPPWRRCLRAFLCGVAMTLGCAMVGSGRILPALMEGSVGAYAFVGAAWMTGLIVVRVVAWRRGRRSRR